MKCTLEEKKSMRGILMIKIAHRGYVSKNNLENSKSAILEAIKLGYDMIEIDIRETKDKRIVLNHDEDLNRVFGIDTKVSDMFLADIKNLVDTLTLEECLELCEGNVGLLVEVKDIVYSKDFFENVFSLIRKYNMVDEVLIYPSRKDIIDFYLGKVIVGVEYSEVLDKKIEEKYKEKIFVLGMPNVWDEKKIGEIHNRNLISLTTVKKSYFNRKYPDENHMILAEKVIHRLKSIGVDGINIDSLYHGFLFKE